MNRFHLAVLVTTFAALVLCARASAQCQTDRLLAVAPAALEWFGISVALDGEWLVVGAPGHDGLQPRVGAVQVYRRVGRAWVFNATLEPADAENVFEFGGSVAIKGDRIAVGAWANTLFGMDTGAAYVFRQIGGEWVQEARLVGDDINGWEHFGWSVSIDGTLLVVGAPGDDQRGCGGAGDNFCDSGSAYVFHLNGATWVQEQKLVAADGARGDGFGQQVALAGWWIVCGSPFDSHASGARAGSAYTFERSSAGVWTQRTKLIASDAAAEDAFGWSVAIDGDDDRILVGAHWDDDGAASAGSAYVFHRWGITWVEEDKLVALDPVAYDQFGQAVAIRGDRALVAKARWTGDFSPRVASAYSFLREDHGTPTWWEDDTWEQSAAVDPPGRQPGDEFGRALALFEDLAAIGAPDDQNNSGSVHLFAFGGDDCNRNGRPDACDIFDGLSRDHEIDGIADECQCFGDLDGSGRVDLTDLAVLLTHFGTPRDASLLDGDLSGDGAVDLTDLALLLAEFGTNCP